MKKEKIVHIGEQILRQKSKEVTVFHKKLHNLIDSMKYTLENNGEGAALAANQISIDKRIVVINYLDEYFEMVNPVIISSEGESIDFEGCLSIDGYHGKVKRAEKVIVKYQNRYGKELTVERSGRLAKIGRASCRERV